MPQRKFQCPKCRFRFLADPEHLSASGETSVVRLMGKTRVEPESRRTVDLKCPNCETEFEVELEV